MNLERNNSKLNDFLTVGSNPVKKTSRQITFLLNDGDKHKNSYSRVLSDISINDYAEDDEILSTESRKQKKTFLLEVKAEIPESLKGTILDLLKKMTSGKSGSEKEDISLRLEEKMKINHLQQMMFAFQNHNPPPIEIIDPTGYSPTKYVEREKGSLNREEFVNTIAGILGTHEYDGQLDKLFTILDVSGDGYVDWNEFCMYMLVQFQENDHLNSKKELPFVVEPRIKLITNNHQETTVKIVATDNPVRYMTISKEGSFSIWDSNLKFEGFSLMTQEENNTNKIKRRFKTWVTDAVYLPNFRKIALTSTSRDMRIFEASSNNVFEEILLYSIPDVPYCLEYYYDKKSGLSRENSLLFVGMDTGLIYMFEFTSPTHMFDPSLKSSETKVKKIFWQNLHKLTTTFKVSTLDSLHTDMIKKIHYIPHNASIIVLSNDRNNPLTISDIYGRNIVYSFKQNKGVECFDYSRSLNLLVTGSSDHSVRFWNPYVVQKPIAVLDGHSVGVIEVKIYEPLFHVYSVSRDDVVKVWDLREYCCVQTIVLKFPFAMPAKLAEHGNFPMHLQINFGHILVCSQDYVALLKIGQKSIPKSAYITSHNAALSCALYNPNCFDVVTAADDSTISVWEVESGVRKFHFGEAHGNEEITCMSFDSLWRRLFTGARDGTIKCWNYRSGHTLQEYEPVGEAEVTGLLQLVETKLLLSVGWNRYLVTYDDSEPDVQYVRADIDWRGGQLHKDDILCAAINPPNLLATASFDGAIYLWSIETEKLFIRLREGQRSSLSAKVREALSYGGKASNSRPNSRHTIRHKTAKGEPTPVDKMIFLTERLKTPEAANLISSEAGYLYWWSVYGSKKQHGHFYGALKRDESILTLSTDSLNEILVTGDTSGHVIVWKIAEFCLEPSQRAPRTLHRPPIELFWRAHDATIVSVEFCQDIRVGGQTAGDFIVTASTDKSCRMWSRNGMYVGTFGQAEPWDLHSVETWCYPETPFTIQEKSDQSRRESQIKEDTNAKTTEDNEKQGDDVLIKTPVDTNEEHAEKIEETKNKSTVEKADTKYTFDLKYDTSNLGYRVESDLERMKQNRKQRRNMNKNENLTLGVRQLTIYSSLKTKEMTETSIPSNLPVSSSMHTDMRNAGISAFNEETLKSFNFNYSEPDDWIVK